MMIDVAQARTIARERFLEYCPDKMPLVLDIKIKEQMEEERQGFLREALSLIEARAAMNDGRIHTSAVSSILTITVDLEDTYESLLNRVVS